MKSYGHINMQQNELQQVAIGLETDFPATPVAGRLVFKNKILYICAEIATGIPAWVPLTQQLSTYIHYEVSGTTTWTINHNLNTATPVVQCYGSDQKMFIPNNIEVTSNNQVLVTTSTPVYGRAVIMQAPLEGTTKPNYTYEHNQTSAATTWVIQHGLGYNPIVRVFVGNAEILPDTIVHNSLFQTTITFTTPQTGVARCI
jgi:hypothetical protein